MLLNIHSFFLSFFNSFIHHSFLPFIHSSFLSFIHPFFHSFFHSAHFIFSYVASDRVKNHSDLEGKSAAATFYMHHPTDRIAHTTAFVTPVVEHWLEREIAQWVHPMKDQSDDPSHHERTLLPRSYILLPHCWIDRKSTIQVEIDKMVTILIASQVWVCVECGSVWSVGLCGV